MVLTNTSVAPTCLKILDELAYLLLPTSPEDKLARTLFAGLQSGNPDKSVLSEDLKQYLTPTRLREYSSSLTPLGAVEAFSLSHMQTTDGLTTREYDVVAGGQKLRLHLLLLADDKVEDVSISKEQ